MSENASALHKEISQARKEHRTLQKSTSDVDIKEAYRIQAALGENRTLKGYKLGLLGPAKQAQMGIDSPIYGRVYADMLLESSVSLSRFIQPRFEPELAVILDHDLPPTTYPEAAWIAVGATFLAVDFLDSVWEGFKFGPSEVVADNASGGGFLLGEQVLHAPFDGQLHLYLDGQLLSEGSLETLGNVGERLSWLAETVGGLTAGQIVFLGSPAAALEARRGTLEVRGPEDSVLVARLED